jgi:oxalate decarboxylase/phosphoglucose isomerase-like protein (cupin superfamily)
MKPAKLIHIDEIQEKTPPGGGGAWRRLISDEATETGLIFGYGIIQPGDGRGWHKHPAGEDESFFVIEGEARLEWKEEGKVQSRVAKAGSAFYTPGDMENNVINVGTTPLKAVFAIVKAKS